MLVGILQSKSKVCCTTLHLVLLLLVSLKAFIIKMQVPCPNSKLKIRGENEREIYKNFVNDYPRGRLEMYMCKAFQKCNLTIKNDEKSISIRKVGNHLYSSGDLNVCLDLFSKSLRYATYKSESYSIALANRSAILFKLCEYEKCIEDIDLCLEAQYPHKLKPKVYLRKCECFRKMGNQEDMMKTANELCKLLQDFEGSAAEKYGNQLTCVVKVPTTLDVSNDKVELQVPSIDESKTFPGASKNVELKKDEDGKFYVSSSSALKKGQVIFAEKAYACSLSRNSRKNCQYCLKSTIREIPCKGCVKHVYCTEMCRNLAWNQFHQWECYGTQANLFDDSDEMVLALRIVFKACQNESIPPFAENIPMDQYSSIYHLPPVLHNKEVLKTDTKNAMFFVYYLKTKTNFFEYLKSLPSFSSNSDDDLMTMVGSLLIRHVSQMQHKVLTIQSYSTLKIDQKGLAACAAVAQMSHSCDPNSIYYFHNDVAVVKAFTDIEPNTRLTIPHRLITYYTHPLNERKKILWDFLHLKCKCLPCSSSLKHLEKLDAYVCIRCKGPAVVDALESRYKCLDCDTVFEMPPEIKSKMYLFDSFLHGFHKWKDVNLAKQALAVSKDFLQPYYKSYVKLYEDIGNYYLENGDPAEALLIFKLLSELIEKRVGSYTIAGALNQIQYSVKVLKCLEEHSSLFSANGTQTALSDVKTALQKAMKFTKLFCPNLLTHLMSLKCKHSAMELRAS